jgi:hypothetical protein
VRTLPIIASHASWHTNASEPPRPFILVELSEYMTAQTFSLCRDVMRARLLPAAPKLILTDPERRRLDESPDAAFYASPRTMQHAEPQFIAAVTGEARLPAGCLHVVQPQLNRCIHGSTAQPLV